MKQQTEFIHGDLYGVAMEVVKKFVQKSDTRPILHYALHTENGDILATDSHRAIQIREIHGFKEEYLVNPKSFMFAKGHYPDVETVIAFKEHQAAITLNKGQIKLWLQLFKSMNNTIKVMKSNRIYVTFHFGEDGVNAEVFIDSETSFKTTLPVAEYKQPNIDSISISVEYLRDALEAHFKLNSQKLTFYLEGQYKPMILDDNEKVKTVILPVRTY